ncbi:MAG: imidazole glycerol phosphate synthase subunit HisH [Planctomycetota bacterium]
MSDQPAMRITFIDYGGGNIGSVTRAFERLDAGVPLHVSDDPAEIAAAPVVVLPGVGHFGQVMHRLRERGLDAAIRDVIAREVPFLGICVGMQVLFDGSEEAPDVPGLGIIRGMVKKFDGATMKVPQIGWNKVRRIREMPGLPDCPAEGFAYFVNSFYCAPDESAAATAAMITDYHGDFCSGVSRGAALTAVQFHPEKSGSYGLGLLRTWTHHALQADHPVS